MLKDLKCNILGYKYNLEFAPRITLISGNSGTGKTVLFKYFKAIEDGNNNSNIMALNTSKVKSLKKSGVDIANLIINTKNKLVVIDNADLILTEPVTKAILFNQDNQYILFGRTCNGLCLDENEIAELEINDNNEIITNYIFKDM